MLVVYRNFLGESHPAAGERPEGMFGGRGERVGLEFRIRSLNRGLGHHCVAPEF